MEQGRATNVSETVLDAVARALQLNEAEHAHLVDLARPSRTTRRPLRPQVVRPPVRRLVESTDIPTAIMGRRSEVLAWNRTMAALIADFGALPRAQRNMARLLFLDETVAALYVDWEAKARDLVGFLRLEAGRNPDDPQLAELVGELSIKSDHFRRLWTSRHVHLRTHGTYHLCHPLVGELTVAYESFHLSDDPEQVLVAYTPTPDDTALRLLAQLTRPEPQQPPATRVS
jgi:hypothetical protein